ncbi:MAG: M42 family metallopeptidase [Planctomycetota bacterium]
MQKTSMEFLRSIMAQPSPSGFEEPVQKLVRNEMESFADTVTTDVHGNVIGCINPEGKLRVMLAGHADEIGLMVNYIDDQGYLWFSTIGGWDPVVLPGQRVFIHNDGGDVFGVIGKKPIHLMESDERSKGVKVKDLWIDIGAKDKKDAEKVVAVGDHATLDAGYAELLNGIVVCRAFDDRIGAFVVLEALRMLSKKKGLKAAVYSVSTVQEEVGLRGARTSAFGIDPHVGIAVDVGFASDFPTVDKKLVGECELGGGPLVAKGCNINPVVRRGLEDTAKKKKIPYQLNPSPKATGTDANAIQLTRAGVATGLVSVPNRYMHTPVEAVSLEDVENTIKLLAEYILTLGEKSRFIPGE